MTNTTKQEELRTKIENMLLIWSSEVSGQPREKLHPEVDQLVLRHIDLINQQVLDAVENANSTILGHIKNGMPLDRLKMILEKRLAKIDKLQYAAIEQVERKYRNE